MNRGDPGPRIEPDVYVERDLAGRGGTKDSLDDQLYRAIREQGAARGLRYEGENPVY